jgi:hypothetical protein
MSSQCITGWICYNGLVDLVVSCTGLVKKDPTANGQAVPAKLGTGQGQAKHIPYCYFHVVWQTVPAGSIAGVQPASATSAKKAAAPAPSLATAAKKAAAPAPAATPASATAASKAAAATPAASATDDLGGGY